MLASFMEGTSDARESVAIISCLIKRRLATDVTLNTKQLERKREGEGGTGNKKYGKIKIFRRKAPLEETAR